MRKKGSIYGYGKGRDIIYEVRLAVVNFLKLNCQPRNKGDDSSPQKPPRYLHRLQLAYHVVNRSQEYATSVPSFVKTYSPRGWTGYIYVFGNVRIRALPRKVIAEFLEDQPFYDEPAEEATIRALEKLKKAVNKWLEEQYSVGVEIELSHPYVMNTPEYLMKSKKLKEWLKKLRAQRKAATLMHNGGTLDTSPIFIKDDGSVWVDDSKGENGADAEAHLETNDPEKSDLLYQGIVNAFNLPSYLQPIQQEIQQIKALLISGLSAQQRFDQLVSIVAHLLKEISILKQELAVLKTKESGFQKIHSV